MNASSSLSRSVPVPDPRPDRSTARVFISYSRKDSDFVRRLGDALAAHKREAWIDWKDIPLTAEWLREILRNIDAANDFIFVISPDSVTSPNCRKEIEYAAANHKRMVPLFYRPVVDDTIPESLNKFQRIDFSRDDSFDTKFAALIEALDTDLEWKQAHTRLLTRAKEWELVGKDRSFLLRGKDLVDAEQWIAKSAELDPKPTILQSQYILSSRQSATKTQRTIIGAVALALLIAIGLAIYAFQEKSVAQRNASEAQHQKSTAEEQKHRAEVNADEAKQQKGVALAKEAEAKHEQVIAVENAAVAQRNAQESRARELATYARENLSEDPELSILLALHAMDTTMRAGKAPVRAAVEVLHQAIMFSHVRMTLRADRATWFNAVAFSPDGKRIVAVSNEDPGKNVRIWDAVSGRGLLAGRGDSQEVHAVAFSADGRYQAMAGHDKTVTLFDASGEALFELAGHKNIVDEVVFSPDSKRLATSSFDGTVKVWNLVNREELFTIPGDWHFIRAVAFSPDGKRIATAKFGHDVRVWDAFSGKLLLSLPRQHPEGEEDGSSASVAYSPDGLHLATTSRNTAKIWDALNGQELLTLRGSHRDSVSVVAFSPDGKFLATASEDGTAKVWNAVNGEELFTLRGHSEAIRGLSYAPDGKRIATASVDGTVKIWDTISEESLTLPGPVCNAAFSANGDKFVTANCDQTASLWDASTGQNLRVFQSDSESVVTAVAYNPNTRRIAIARADEAVKILNADNGQELLPLGGDSEDAYLVAAFSSDGNRILTARPDKIRLWDAGTGRQLLQLDEKVNAATLSPDGRRIAAAIASPGVFSYGKGTINVWDDEGKTTLSLFQPQITSTVMAGPVRKMTIETPGVVSSKILPSSDEFTAVAFNSDGTRLATGSLAMPPGIWDVRELPKLCQKVIHRKEVHFGSVKIETVEYGWCTPEDAKVGKRYATVKHELHVFRGHAARVNAVALSPDGKYLATGSSDKTIKLWDAVAGQELLTLHASEAVGIVTFISNGSHLAALTGDKTLRIYALEIHELLKLAHSRVTRDLTPNECERYFQSKNCPRLP